MIKVSISRDKRDKPESLRSRIKQRWGTHKSLVGSIVWFIVSVVFVLLGTTGIVSKPVAYTCTLLGILLLVAEFYHHGWKIYVTSNLRKLLEESQKVAASAQGAEQAAWKIASQYGVSLIGQKTDTRERMIMDKLLIPIGHHSAELLDDHPLSRKLSIQLLAERIPDASGEYICVDRTMTWEVPLEPRLSAISQVVKPIFVFTSQVRLIETLTYLQERGLIDVLWPVPRGWVKDANPSPPTGRKWLTFKGLEYSSDGAFPKHKVPLDQIKEFKLSSFESLCNFLANWLTAEDLGKFKTGGKNEEKLIMENCLGIWYVDKQIGISEKAGGTNLQIKQQDQYMVWVKGKEPNQILYRYEMLFSQPAQVASIEFELGTEARGIWQLDAPAVYCPFAPDNPSAPDNEKDYTKKERRSIKWNKFPEGVPFLPGHGVAFSWYTKK